MVSETVVADWSRWAACH